eukprot:jgi/Mesen1/9398/ME000614S08653
MAIESLFVESTEKVKLHAKVFSSQNSGDGEGSVCSRPTVVLVHPYSLLGGCQECMQGLARELSTLGYTCVTFNLRGVGKSSGRATLTGHAEVHDVLAVCDWAATRFSSRVLLVGSSAGAPIAGSALSLAPAVHAYVAIGYTFGRWSSVLFGRHYSAVLQCPKPKLFIMGTNDGFTSVKQLDSRVTSANGETVTHFVEGRGHFELEGPAYDSHMAEVITDFSQRHES